jgi:hypothetical protein
MPRLKSPTCESRRVVLLFDLPSRPMARSFDPWQELARPGLSNPSPLKGDQGLLGDRINFARRNKAAHKGMRAMKTIKNM